MTTPSLINLSLINLPSSDLIATDFFAALVRALSRRRMRYEEVCPPGNELAARVLREYGAMFVADSSVSVPPVCVFENEAQVADFQRDAGIRSEIFTTPEGEEIEIELQPAASDALVRARRRAEESGLTLTPRGGSEAARRTYADTLRLWHSRFFPALEHWTTRERLTREQVVSLCAMPTSEQIAAVLRLELDGVFFSKDFSKSVLYSVAAPGTSQHLSMLAFDVAEFQDERVRQILYEHGWFQTVRSDLPHFTFLGMDERELPARGLHCIEEHEQRFWIPDVRERHIIET